VDVAEGPEGWGFLPTVIARRVGSFDYSPAEAARLPRSTSATITGATPGETLDRRGTVS
jgi:hypothetical protein